MKRIPLIPVPIEKAKSISRRLRWISKSLVVLVPGLKRDLYQSEINIKPIEYMGIVLFSSIFYSVLLGGLTSLLSVIFRGVLDPMGIIIGLFFFFVTFYFLSFYPHIITKRRVKSLEMNLLFVLRHILIEVRSGIPLFNAMVGVSTGYGEISKEFEKVVKDVTGGLDEVDALNKIAERNPSIYFRRAIWQIVNALKAGSDIGDTLEAITDDFSQKQITEIKSYGQQLNPWTMLYMIIAVIVPSLGLTFLIILSSFSGITIPKVIFSLIFVGLFLFQIFFMGFIKSKRPSVVI
ncbi:MAG: type II secretion system F family protein [Candidatus Aenigmarchaeota archaeon]|nr:type II secretion system F family protein [Candidatus Aenigmarchaeota archaeon]